MEMEEAKIVGEKPEKMSYEQLENIAHQLSEQNRLMYNKIQQMDATNIFKRLDYLFKVAENKEMFSSDFVIKCTDEIVNIMTIPEETEEESKE